MYVTKMDTIVRVVAILTTIASLINAEQCYNDFYNVTKTCTFGCCNYDYYNGATCCQQLGAILGVVFGGLAIVGITVVLIWCKLKQISDQNSKVADADKELSPVTHVTVEPCSPPEKGDVVGFDMNAPHTDYQGVPLPKKDGVDDGQPSLNTPDNDNDSDHDSSSVCSSEESEQTGGTNSPTAPEPEPAPAPTAEIGPQYDADSISSESCYTSTESWRSSSLDTTDRESFETASYESRDSRENSSGADTYCYDTDSHYSSDTASDDVT